MWIKKQYTLTNKNRIKIMSLIKDEDEERGDYILQKDKTTKGVSSFVIIALVILVIAVIVSGFYFKWF